MIPQDYVSFETAKLLKEKGFSENTVCKYADVGGVTEKWYDDYRERVLRFDWDEGYLIEPLIEPKEQYEIIGDTIFAPTLQMAMKWLREVHTIFIDVMTYTTGNKIQFRWVGYDKDRLFSQEEGRTIYFESYEQAVETAIKYTLENLI